MSFFEIISEIIAVTTGIREAKRLRKQCGRGRWRKLKGFAEVRLEDGSIHVADLRWYEAHGIGRKEFKIKKFFGTADE
ncbi:MAG: hypothetical protein IVW51_16670 [Thermaceae bacterium]|nr:hypothetical protein [Thermaceae bacterium]